MTINKAEERKCSRRDVSKSQKRKTRFLPELFSLVSFPGGALSPGKRVSYGGDNENWMGTAECGGKWGRGE